jgi:hypothetical protein
MDLFLRRLFADWLVVSADAVDAHKASFLDAAASAIRATATRCQQMASAAIADADFGFIGNSVKAPIARGINQAISNVAVACESQTPVLLASVVTSARTYARKLYG